MDKNGINVHSDEM